MRILQIDTAITGPASVTRGLTAKIVAAEARAHPGSEVIVRDLAVTPLAHLGPAHAQALQGAMPEDAATRDDIAAGKAALDEFLAADVVVIGAPMYNFAIASQLKAWIDRITVPGATFRYGANGPEGMVEGKRVVIASARGGLYGPGTRDAPLDHQETYLRALFGFLGVTDVTIVRAEGLKISDEARAQALAEADAAIDRLAA